MSSVRAIVAEVDREVVRQQQIAFDGNTAEFDKGHSQNDWLAYIANYLGRAAKKISRDERVKGEAFRENLLKVAALCVSAIKNYDEGNC
jgi:hypothetical protein